MVFARKTRCALRDKVDRAPHHEFGSACIPGGAGFAAQDIDQTTSLAWAVYIALRSINSGHAALVALLAVGAHSTLHVLDDYERKVARDLLAFLPGLPLSCAAFVYASLAGFGRRSYLAREFSCFPSRASTGRRRLGTRLPLLHTHTNRVVRLVSTNSKIEAAG